MSSRWLRFVLGASLGGWTGGAQSVAAGSRTVVPVGSRMDDAEARLTYARILGYRRETSSEAVKAYERLLREHSDHALARAELAELWIRQGNLAAAEAELRRALAQGTDNPAAVAALAKILLWTTRAEDAVALLSRAAQSRKLTDAEWIVRGEALGTLGRSAEAARELDELIVASPSPPAELLSAAADAQLTAGNIARAGEWYRRALGLDSTLPAAQRGYALALSWSGEHGAARDRLATLLNSTSRDEDVIQAYLRSVRETEGLEIAISRGRSRSEAAPHNARWRAEWADLEAQRGHAVKSQRLFAEALALESTPELQLQAARAGILGGDFIPAERTLREALRRKPNDVRLRDDLGRLLVSIDRTEEAEQFYEQWLADQPAAEAAWLGMIRLRLKERNYALALLRCDRLLELRPQLAEALQLKAEALAGLGRTREALVVYAQLAGRPETRVEAELAQGRAAVHRGDMAAAATHLATVRAADPLRPAAVFHSAGKKETRSEDFLRRVTGGTEGVYDEREPAVRVQVAVPESAPKLVEWAGLYAQQGDFGLAVRCLKAARVRDPEYFPAHLQLAEFLAIDAKYDDALREFASLRELLPQNRQILLGEARALAWGRRYDESLEAYARLADRNSADPVPRREAARTAGWGKRRERGAELYATAWKENPVDQKLAAQLRVILDGADGSPVVQRWRRWAEQPEEAAEPFYWTERFSAERFELRGALPENRRARIDQVHTDLLAALRLQRAWWLEDRAKQSAWDRRYAASESYFSRLLTVEPGNEEAMFDLAQVQAAQGLGQREAATLTRLVAIDANHRLATEALRRREIRSDPLATIEGRYWRERGRGELSSLRRTVLAGRVEDTSSHQYTVRLEGELGREKPTTRTGRYAYRSIGFGAEGVVTPWLSGSASFKHREFYDQRIGHADSGQAQVWLAHNSVAAGVGYEKREELTNEFALFQGTRSDQVWLGGRAVVPRQLEVNARATSMKYSDDNAGWMMTVQPAYAWTDHPRLFKTILILEARDTDDETNFVRTGGLLTNLIHPYWTPRNYVHGALTLEWYHDLARDFFAGAQQHYYDVRVTFGTDSESNPGVTFEADWRREWHDRWMAQASVYLHESKEWDALGLRLWLARRF